MHRRHYSRSYSHDTGFFFTAATNSWLSSVHSHFLWAIYLRLSEYTAFSRHHFNHQQTELLTYKICENISSYISDTFVIKGSIFFLKITFFIIISPLLRGTRCEEEIQSYSHWRLHKINLEWQTYRSGIHFASAREASGELTANCRKHITTLLSKPMSYS